MFFILNKINSNKDIGDKPKAYVENMLLKEITKILKDIKNSSKDTFTYIPSEELGYL